QAGRCQGCKVALSIAEMNQIKAAAPDEVLRCEECRRILVRTAESGIRACEPGPPPSRPVLERKYVSTYIVEADGGSRGNPGPAGYGAVVRDAADGQVLAEAAEAIGVATNNVAEYRGLIAGLRAALAVGG